MGNYRHFVSGLFLEPEDAQRALAALLDCGLPRDRLHLFPDGLSPRPESNKALNNILVDTAIGTAVGTGLGALGEIALVAANVSLFAASPVIAPLVMLGWGASVGALIGAAYGAETTRPRKSRLAELIDDAVSVGQTVLVVDTLSPEESASASEIVRAAAGDTRDMSAPDAA